MRLTPTIKAITPHYQHGGISIYHGDCLDVLPQLPTGSVHCCVTSPPYWGLRDYGTAEWEGGDEECDHVQGAYRRDEGERTFDGGPCHGGVKLYKGTCPECGARRIDSQLGLEATLDEFIAKMVEVFRAVWRVLRDDGTCWVNLGDAYNAYNHNRGPSGSISGRGDKHPSADRGLTTKNLKPKDLVGMPWRVAFALQADGWFLRSDIIWAKPNPMPESVTDRPTKSHEYLFLLTKQPRYFYDAEAVKTPLSPKTLSVNTTPTKGSGTESTGEKLNAWMKANGGRYHPTTANLRDVWTVPTKSYPGAHFATFPPKLIEPCIQAGTSEEGCCPECGAPWERVVEKNLVATRPARDNVNDPTGMANRDPKRHVTTSTTTGWGPGCECDAGDPIPCAVLDPFIGSGTTAEVARQNGCRCIGIELSEEYIALAAKRLKQGTLFG
jgi:DNA modification methylase